MQSVLQSHLLRLAGDEFLDSVQLAFTARLKSTGVMENISLMVREDEFILNIVMATLSAESS
jgi:hypothetical protein